MLIIPTNDVTLCQGLVTFLINGFFFRGAGRSAITVHRFFRSGPIILIKCEYGSVLTTTQASLVLSVIAFFRNVRFEHDILQPCTRGVVVNERLLHAFRHRRFYCVFICPGTIDLMRRKCVYFLQKIGAKRKRYRIHSQLVFK